MTSGFGVRKFQVNEIPYIKQRNRKMHVMFRDSQTDRDRQTKRQRRRGIYFKDLAHMSVETWRVPNLMR